MYCSEQPHTKLFKLLEKVTIPYKGGRRRKEEKGTKGIYRKDHPCNLCNAGAIEKVVCRAGRMASGTDPAWNLLASAFSLTSMVLPASGAMVQQLQTQR